MTKAPARRQPPKDFFSTDKIKVEELLQQVHDGSLQLPNFQRDWKWENDAIVSLMESIGECAPIGAIMIIETGGHLKFDHIPVFSVDPLSVVGTSPSRLIMDGQQRVTSMYQVLYSKKPVALRKGKKTEYRYYYFDMEKASEAGRDLSESIISVAVDETGHPLQNGHEDYSNPSVLFERRIFPLNFMFDFREWEKQYKTYWDERPDTPREARHAANGHIDDFRESIQQPFTSCQIPMIVLRRGIDIKAVSKLYQKINTAGVALDTFDLLIAGFAAEGFNLREDWLTIQKRFAEMPLMDDMKSTNFLHAAYMMTSVMNDRAPSTDKEAILGIKLSEYKEARDKLMRGYELATKFLQFKQLHNMKDAPSIYVRTALAIVFALLNRDSENHPVREKITRWFWCITFSGHYANGNNAQVGTDILAVLAWVRGQRTIPPDSVERILLIDEAIIGREVTKSKSLRHGIAGMLLGRVRDFSTGNTISEHNRIENRYDMHHLFPKKWCEDNNIPKHLYNTAANMSPLSATTNRKIGGKAPSEYLKEIELSLGITPATMDAYLESHGINHIHFRNDDFHAFLEDRKLHLIGLVESLTGAQIAKIHSLGGEGSLTDRGEFGDVFHLDSRGVQITAIRQPSGMVIVMPGSTMTADTNPSLRAGYGTFRDQLIEHGKVTAVGDGTYRLIEAVTVESLSFAGSVFTGRMTNAEDWRELGPKDSSEDPDDPDQKSLL